MVVSTRGRYALRVMIDLAKQNNASYTPLRNIARRQQIPENFEDPELPALPEALKGVPPCPAFTALPIS